MSRMGWAALALMGWASAALATGFEDIEIDTSGFPGGTFEVYASPEEIALRCVGCDVPVRLNVYNIQDPSWVLQGVALLSPENTTVVLQACVARGMGDCRISNVSLGEDRLALLLEYKYTRRNMYVEELHIQTGPAAEVLLQSMHATPAQTEENLITLLDQLLPYFPK